MEAKEDALKPVQLEVVKLLVMDFDVGIWRDCTDMLVVILMVALAH